MSRPIEGWTSLCNALERQWRYADAIELANNRPEQDIVGQIKSGCIVRSFSLHAYLDHRLPYWQARDAGLQGLYEKAMEHYRQADLQEESIMEMAVTAGRLDDEEQMYSWLTKLLPSA